MSNNIKGGANQQRGLDQLITIKSDVTIEFNRYESVFYYETLELYTSEFVNLISYVPNVPATINLNDFLIVKNDEPTCKADSTKLCKPLMEIKDSALTTTQKPEITIIQKGVGSYILESIIFNKIYKHSLINLINEPTNQKNTLII